MTTLTVTLPEPLDRFVDAEVSSGAYPDRESVIRAGLERLAASSEAVRETRFRALLQEGSDQLDRGEGIEVTDVTAWLDGLGRGAGR